MTDSVLIIKISNIGVNYHEIFDFIILQAEIPE